LQEELAVQEKEAAVVELVVIDHLHVFQLAAVLLWELSLLVVEVVELEEITLVIQEATHHLLFHAQHILPMAVEVVDHKSPEEELEMPAVLVVEVEEALLALQEEQEILLR
tara:strand:- start:56 stop:388 length:333 start_codon:yes stop_codon:yes gene_type:complete